MTSQASNPQPHLTAQKSGGHYFWLDWLRFGAAFLVLICHTRNNTWVDWGQIEPRYHTLPAAAFIALCRLGYEAVIVFFVLSGFFVGGKNLERLIHRNFQLPDYALDRATRIYLPLFPALIFSVLVGWITTKSQSWADIFGSFFGLQGLFCSVPSTNAPLWSLADEIWFYLALVFLALAWVGRGWIKILGVAGCILCLGAFWQLGFLYFICWALGAAFFFCPRHNFLLIAGLILTALGFALRQIASQSVSISLPVWASYLPGNESSTFILALGVGVLLPNLGGLIPRSASAAWLEKTGQSLAAFSYTLYLTHYPLVVLLQFLWPEHFTRLDLISFTYFLGKVLLCLTAAWLIYLPFEAQTTQVRRWVKDSFLPPSLKKPLVPAPRSG